MKPGKLEINAPVPADLLKEAYEILRICEVEVMPDVTPGGEPIGNAQLHQRVRALLKRMEGLVKK